MLIYFLGSYFPSSKYMDIVSNSKGAIANANNLWQQNILKGLKDLNANFHTYSFPQIGAYPIRYKKMYFRGDIECGTFLNLPLVKYLSRYIRSYLYLKKAIVATHSEDVVIWTYDLHIPFILALLKIKKKINCKLCLFVPDLIGNTGSPNHFVYRIKERIEKKIVSKHISQIDYFVLLTRQMAKALQISPESYVVIEGMTANEIIESNTGTQKKTKTLFYSGAIDERNGVVRLIEAFELLPHDYQIMLCGDGPLRYWLENKVKSNNRIKYYGQIPHNEVVELQKNASLLVNPRLGIEEFTKYSFPSKTIEYYASATPVLMYKLDGIPDEYYQYCYTPNDNSVEGLASEIKRIHDLPSSELKMKGEQARNFIYENKTPKLQVSKILDLINNDNSSN